MSAMLVEEEEVDMEHHGMCILFAPFVFGGFSPRSHN